MPKIGHFPQKAPKVRDSGVPGRGFYINPSRRGPAVPAGVPRWSRDATERGVPPGLTGPRGGLKYSCSDAWDDKSSCFFASGDPCLYLVTLYRRSGATVTAVRPTSAPYWLRQGHPAQGDDPRRRSAGPRNRGAPARGVDVKPPSARAPGRGPRPLRGSGGPFWAPPAPGRGIPGSGIRGLPGPLVPGPSGRGPESPPGPPGASRAPPP